MALLQFDYESILTELTNKLQTKLGGTITGGSSAQRILEVVSEKLAQTARYAEYLTRETKWSLAQNASSILTQLELFGYTPHRKVGASGYIRVSADPAFSSPYMNDIVIPKFSRFSNGELTFCTTEVATLLRTQSYVDIPVIQGSLSVLEFSGSDINNYRYQLMNNSIENSLYELRQNSILMTEVEAFGDTQLSYNDVEGSSQVGGQYEYKLRNIQGFEGIELQFPSGDEFTTQDQFVFRYLITEGVNGNVTAIDSITTPLDQYTDSQGISVRVYCTNPYAVTGGNDYETIDEMRDNAPLSFNRVDKYITRNDYISAITTALQGSGIFYIWTEQEANERVPQFNDSYDFFNNSKIFICGCTYDPVSRVLTPWNNTDQLQILNDNKDIQSHKGLTDYFVMEDPSIIYFYLNGTIYFNRSLTDATLARSSVSGMIMDAYNENNIEFANNIYHSDYISLFKDMEEIDHVDVEINLYMFLNIVTQMVNGVYPDPATTEMIEDFGFSSSESNRYYITLYDSNTNQLVQDLTYVEQKDGVFNWYDAEDTQGLTPLNPEDPDYLGWVSSAQNPATGVFGSLNIKGKYLDIINQYNQSSQTEQENEDGTEAESVSYPAHLVVRFKPYNGDAVLMDQNQIISLTYSNDITNIWKSPEDDPTKYSNNAEYTMIFSEVSD